MVLFHELYKFILNLMQIIYFMILSALGSLVAEKTAPNFPDTFS